jgi:hypothetical protein
VLWSTNRARSVSLLKLELQVEVDKVFVAAFLFARQQSPVPAALNEWLFGAPILHVRCRPPRATATPASTARLEQQFMRIGQRGPEGARRGFYRSPQREKLRYMEHTA